MKQHCLVIDMNYFVSELKYFQMIKAHYVMFQLDLNATMFLSQCDDDGDDSVMFLKAVVLFRMVILVVPQIVSDGDSRDP